ncbi:MAG TPA: alcohol dehydrogenase catalytic domain-containing protein [Nitrososphaerales archaeon]|nr:alcohol dehydrogenase catalytic domain-containing protein [Nitrososphaerales archaeon]
MKAARLYSTGKPLVVEDAPDPGVTPGSVKVKIAKCGVCRTDVHFVIEGLMKPAFIPQIMGHEAAGEVVELGSNVHDLKLGDRVIISTTQGCDSCDYCRSGRENLCRHPRTFGFQVDGGYAEYAVVPSNYAVKMPENLSWDSCVLADAGAAAHHAVTHVGKIKSEDTVLIMGAGGLGLFATQICKIIGSQVIVADIEQSKLEIAKSLKSDYVINTNEPDFAKKVAEMTSGDGPDAILEFVSTSETITTDFEIVRKGGRVVFIGYHPQGRINVNPIQLILKESTLLFSKGATLQDLVRVVELAGEGKLRTSVDRTLPLSKVNEALALMSDNKVLGRICIDTQSS